MGVFGLCRSMICAVALGAASILIVPNHVLAGTSGLASHRAIYQMTLKSADQSSDIAELDGRMLIEVIDVCDGWTLRQGIVLTITNSHGDQVTSYTDFTSWESKDGRRFRFEQKTHQDGQLIEELDGEAAINPDGSGGVAIIAKPQDMILDLAPGTLLPSGHTKLLIASAEAGERFVSRTVFDGTTLDGPSRITAFIAAPVTVASLPGETAVQRAWPVRLAFFNAASAAPDPDVEIGLMLQANGVTRDLTIEYKDFAIAGRIEKLELLPVTDCSRTYL